MVCVDAFVSDWCKPPRCQEEKRGELREVSIDLICLICLIHVEKIEKVEEELKGMEVGQPLLWKRAQTVNFNWFGVVPGKAGGYTLLNSQG